MAILNRECSQCRRAGDKLMLKGDKCLGPKCPMLKRNFAPGQHGPTARRGKKKSGYGAQLAVKQAAKRMYGLRERQFSNYIAEAENKTGDSSKTLVTFLESRLDNVVYRMGLAKSRLAARQLVSHGHIAINGEKVDIASYRVRVGEVVSIREKKQSKKTMEGMKEALTKIEAPAWISVDAKTLSGKVLNTPSLDVVPFDAKAIIEFYSR